MPDLTTLPDVLARLLDAALAGGREVLDVYASDFAVRTKADASPVSAADERAEAAIEARLAADFPDVPVVAEEAVSEGRVPEAAARFLLVDPLDGTKEFVRRNGEFTVNIALIEGGRPVAGVVLAPALRRLFAGAGETAFAGDTDAGCARLDTLSRIRTRPVDGAPVAVASRSHSNPETEAALERIGAGERRSIGSSLKFCLVAAGEADIYPRFGPTMEWDTAAGDAVLRAAGGIVARLDGTPLDYGKRGVPGMRDFENPFFVAAGDRALLRRLVAA